MYWLIAVVLTVLFCACSGGTEQSKIDEARVYLGYLDKKVCQGKYEQTSAEYNYFTNHTKENFDKMIEQDSRPELFDADVVYFDWKSFNDSMILRQAKLYKLLRKKVDDELLESLSDITGQMIEAEDAVNLCFYNNRSVCGKIVNNALPTIFATSRDAKELEYYWLQTHDGVGSIVRPLYVDYVNVSNMIARQRNFLNRADEWMDEFEAPPIDKFESVMVDLWKQVKPLYLQFYSFVRSRLRTVFGEELVTKTGPIPAHLLGSVTGTFINSQLEELKPYPGKPSTDVTEQLIKQNYTVKRIIELGEDFYQSMDLGVLPDNFWNYSMFEQPKDRNVTCAAASWDFYNSFDYRMSICGLPNMKTIYASLHELGHIHYHMGFKKQPCCFKEAANQGMDEGVADTMGLSFTSFKHLARLGLIEHPCKNDPEVEINSLFVQAQDKLSILPMTILLDLYRWNLFRGNIPPSNYNTAYWDYRLEYQGVKAPLPRSEHFLDAADKIQVVSDSQEIIYVQSTILSFQFIEALCIAAGEYDPNNSQDKPLHNCDLYGSTKAGDLMKKLYELGASQPWPVGVAAVTGQPNLDAEPLLRYYKKLNDWLVAENKRTNEYIGWK